MARRLRRLTPAWLLYITGTLIAAGYVTIAVAHGLSQRVVPVTIQRVGPAPSPAGEWLNQTFHHSHSVSSYQDNSGVNDMSWQFWIRYHGCPVTSHGALRLTLYQTPFSESALTASAAVQHETLYSRTLVENRSSGSTTYEFPGRQETFWFIHVDVPSRKGCSGWQYGATTN